jgi:ribosomal protein S18 acetylase RimI-like enzyme
MIEALPPFPADMQLRTVRPRDERFLLGLYGTVRVPELVLTGWSAAQKQAFVADQFRLQQAHYRQNCPDADYWVIERAGAEAIGRFSLDRSGAEWRMIELALLPEARGGGIGTRLIAWVQEAAQGAGADAVTLHVEATNHAAQRLYARLGFVEAPSRFETHRFLRWTPNA